MPWVWIEGKNDTLEDKGNLLLIQNYIANFEAGYKGTAQDFTNVMTLFKNQFKTTKEIQVLTAAKNVQP